MKTELSEYKLEA